MRNRLLSGFVSLLAVVLSSAETAAQEPPGPDALNSTLAVNAPNEPHRNLKESKVIRARRIRGTPPAIDGHLNDQVWSIAEVATGFIQRDPDDGRPMTEQTRLQVAYDDRYLYVAVACDDSDPDGIAAGLSRRDSMGQTDWVTVAFDPRHDHQTGYIFQTNPSAVQVDFSMFNDENQDRDYNAVWDVRTARTERGWTAEYRIPFSQMRFAAAPEPGQVWGFGSARQIRRKGEFGSWVGRPRGERGEVSTWGHLVFEAPIAPPRRLELIPYVLARSEHVPERAATGGGGAGIDLRAGIGTGATVSATLNPDFGQVEQDPAVLNLSVFETFFPEQRPFFLEDSRTFVPPYGLFQLFHSRRIGRTPGRLPLAAGDQLVRRPSDTTILGATKLTGKGSGWTYGVLTALTAREYALVDAPFTADVGGVGFVRQERLIEPATSYNVARLQRDIRGGTSNVGGILTGVVREQADDAFTGGFDYNLRWDRNRTGWNGHWVITRAPGPGGVKTGGGGVTNVNVSRKHVSAGAHFDHFGRDFRVTDIGFFRTRANRNEVNGSFEAGTPDPWKAFRRIFTGVSVAQTWTNERLLIGRGAQMFVSMQFRNFWNVSGGTGGDFRRFDDLDTRGGPPILRPASRYVFVNVNSDSRKSWRWNMSGNGGRSEFGGSGGGLFTGLSVQPTDRMQASVSVNYNFGHDMAQWIRNVDADGDGAIDHVYGELRRNVVDLTVRGTYAFTRDLTVQAYLQPFVAVGAYDNIRRLARPMSFDFEPVTIPFNPDFNRKSLRGNIVMRWEYQPGSVLFFVWDLAQADLSRPGEFSPFRDLRSAFGASASHIFMIKASYWFNR